MVLAQQLVGDQGDGFSNPLFVRAENFDAPTSNFALKFYYGDARWLNFRSAWTQLGQLH